jgi:hypothetical protein
MDVSALDLTTSLKISTISQAKNHDSATPPYLKSKSVCRIRYLMHQIKKKYKELNLPITLKTLHKRRFQRP